MEPQGRAKLGRVDLEVTRFGFGTAPVGNLFRPIDEQTSDAMFQTSWGSRNSAISIPPPCMGMASRNFGPDNR